MSKRTYRAISVNDVSVEALAAKLRPGERVVIGIDVAKVENNAAIFQGETLIRMLGWKAPKESRALVELVVGLNRLAPVEVVIESTGTYGDRLRALLAEVSVPVFRVSTKHVSDTAEMFDGTPSSHDAKAAQQLAWLHQQKRSKLWPIKDDEARDLSALLALYELHNGQLVGCIGRLEGLMARHFPEMSATVSLSNASTLAVVGQFGSPSEIAANAEAADALMHDVGGPLLKDEKVDSVIEAAKNSTGLPMTATERKVLMLLAEEAIRQRALKAAAKLDLEKLAKHNEVVMRLAPVLGVTTAAVVFVEASDPAQYKSPAAFVKALGLNLKEKSSGEHKGKLKISKRGSARARKYLYLATQRLIQRDALFKAWYGRKVEREGGKRKPMAIVALMRKLARALFHVAKGATFDSTKLFDARRLGVAT